MYSFPMLLQVLRAVLTAVMWLPTLKGQPSAELLIARTARPGLISAAIDE